MHACLRVHLNQAKVWGMVENNPAIGVKLPRRKQRKPTILLPLATIGKVIELSSRAHQNGRRIKRIRIAAYR